MTGLLGPEALADWAEPSQAPMAAPRRGARRQAYWPGARMLSLSGSTFEAVTALVN